MAGFEIDFTSNVKQGAASLRNYERKQLPTMVQRALNKTLRSAFTLTKRVMSHKINMTQGKIGKRLKQIPAHNHNGLAILKVDAQKPPNLGSYRHSRPKKVIKGKKRLAGKGVYAKAWERRILYKGAFIWMQPSGSETIFKRRKGAEKKVTKGTGDKYKAKRGGHYKGGFIAKGQPLKRQPLDPVFGPDLAQVFISRPKRGQAPIKIIKRLLPPIWKKNFEHELSRSRRR